MCKRYHIYQHAWLYWQKHQTTQLVMCFKLLHWIKWSFCYWWINGRWWRFGTSIYLVSSLLKCQLLFVAQVTLTWLWKDVLFVFEARIVGTRKSDHMKEYCTEMMQHLGFLFRIFNSINWKLDFHLPHVCILGRNHCASKRNGVFLSPNNK